MWSNALVFLFSVPLYCCLDNIAVEFSIDYFEHRNVPYVCLLSCKKNRLWGHKFTKRAMTKFIAVSEVDIRNSYNLNKCFQRYGTSVGILVDSECNAFGAVLEFASQNMLFDSMHKWLIIDESQDTNTNKNYHSNKREDVDNNDTAELDAYKEYDAEGFDIKAKALLGNLNISVDADITLSKPKGYNYELFEAFNFGKVQGGDLILNSLGTWKPETGLNVNLNGYKYYRRWNFQRWTMRLIGVISPPPKKFDPEMIIGRKSFPGVSTIIRTAAMAFNVVAEVHNFSFKYTITDRWVGLLTRNNSKVAATSLFYREQDVTPVLRYNTELYEKIDFLQPPLTYIETKYYYQIPTRGAGKFENQFLRPLSSSVWGCLIAVITLCAFALLLSAKLEQRPSSAQYALFSALASVCQQFFDDNSDNAVKRVSVARKVTVLVTAISCLLIYNYYTSSVVSWLLSGPPPSINSLQELLESPLELIYEDIGYSRSWLQVPTYYYNKRNSKIEDELRLKKVFNRKTDTPLFLPLDDGIDMVKAGGYAYHTEVDTANKLISRKFTQSELCELGSVQSMAKTKLYAGVQKNSPYREFFNWSLMRLLERGVVSCLQRRTRSAPVACEGSSPRALALGGAAPAFLLLAAGYLLATAIMLLERLTKRAYGLR